MASNKRAVGIITHLAFYSGWSNAASAVAIARDIFKRRGPGLISFRRIARASALNEAAEADAPRGRGGFWSGCSGVARYTTTCFSATCGYSCLAPRDRSLVTVSALIASGQVRRLHITQSGNDNGLTNRRHRSAHSACFLCGLAKCIFGIARRQSVFEKRPMTQGGEQCPRHRQALAGKSEQQKTRLADKITKDVMEVFDYGEDSVSVGFEEIKSKDWKEKVTSRIFKTSGTSFTRTWIRDVRRSTQPAKGKTK